MKYERREEIEVVEYKAGMEEGFSCIPLVAECKYFDKESGKYFQCHKCPLDIPKLPHIGEFYIDSHRKFLVYDGDELIDVLDQERLDRDWKPKRESEISSVIPELEKWLEVVEFTRVHFHDVYEECKDIESNVNWWLYIHEKIVYIDSTLICLAKVIEHMKGIDNG